MAGRYHSAQVNELSFGVLVMKRSFGLAMILMLVMTQTPILVASGSTNPSTGGVQTFTGEITESLCPKTHDDMMKEMKNMRMDKLTCERTCIQMGAKYTLYDAATQQVYRLNDPQKVEPFAGKKVRITGSLKKNTIAIQDIEAID
jgi:hypothetical protein